MSLRDHFAAIWRRRWVVLALTVVVTALVFVWFDRQASVYQSVAQVSVTPGQSTLGSGSASTDTLFLTATYAELGDTAPVISDAVKRSGLHLDELTAAKRLSVSASTTVAVISVTGTGSSAQAARSLAQAGADALISAATAQQSTNLANALKTVSDQIANVSGQLAGAAPGSSQYLSLQSQLQALQQVATTRQSQSFDELGIIAPAPLNASPTSPRPKTDALLAFVTSLVIFAELAVLLEVLGDHFPSDQVEEEVAKVSGLAVLAMVPEGEGIQATEAFRKLRAALLFMTKDQLSRTIAVIGSDPGSGKTFVSVNLATALAEFGSTVVLVDGDMRRPMVHRRLGVGRSPGLSEALGGGGFQRALQRPRNHNGLKVLAAGKPATDPSGLLAQSLEDEVFKALPSAHNTADSFVVVDTPPEALFPDALTIAAQCDLTILVVDARNGRRRALRHCVEELNRVGAEPFGIVLNRAPAGSGDAANYYDSERRWQSRLQKRFEFLPFVARQRPAPVATPTPTRRKTKTVTPR